MVLSFIVQSSLITFIEAFQKQQPTFLHESLVTGDLQGLIYNSRLGERRVRTLPAFVTELKLS